MNCYNKLSQRVRVWTAFLLAAVWMLIVFQGGTAAAGNSAAAVNAKLVPPNNYIDFGLIRWSHGFGFSNQGYVDIPVYRWLNTKGEARVDYETHSITAVAGCDYVESSGTLLFADGEVKKKIRILLNKEGCSADAMFSVKLFDHSTGKLQDIIDYKIIYWGGGAESPIEIYTHGCSDYELAVGPCPAKMEGESIEFNISLFGIVTDRVTVDYTITSDHAIAGVDYAGAVSGTAVIEPGERVAKVVIPFIDDGLEEQNESITITLSNPTGNAFLSPEFQSSMTVQIVDRPAPAIVEFKDAMYYCIEESGWADIQVVRKGNMKGRVGAEYWLFSNTATFREDFVGDPLKYGNPDGLVIFEDGETKKTIRVKLVDDSLKEYKESFGIVLSANWNNLVSIRDNYVAEVVIFDTDHLPKQ